MAAPFITKMAVFFLLAIFFTADSYRAEDLLVGSAAHLTSNNNNQKQTAEQILDIINVDHDITEEDVLELTQQQEHDGRDLAGRRKRRQHKKQLKVTNDPSRFNIAFGYTSELTPDQKLGFTNARKKWTSIITRDSAASACIPAGRVYCGFRFTKATCIDDLFIGINLRTIDGVGKIAGQAGPCAVDDTSVRIGVMTFDVDDANTLIKNGIWESTILHEMGHVLGLGTLWEYQHLITPRTSPAPFYYLGQNGNEGLSTITGKTNDQIIIEDQGGLGTARSHWKESVYDGELMTGYLERTKAQMPLSLMTVRALEDIGFTVDYTKADPYTVPTEVGRRLRKATEGAEKIARGNDVLVLPITHLEDDVLKVKVGREEEFKQKRENYRNKKHNNDNQ